MCLFNTNMKISKYHNRFQIGVTTVLSVIFAALFFALTIEAYGFLLSTLLTAVGVVFIWIIYFIRILIFTVLLKE